MLALDFLLWVRTSGSTGSGEGAWEVDRPRVRLEVLFFDEETGLLRERFDALGDSVGIFDC